MTTHENVDETKGEENEEKVIGVDPLCVRSHDVFAGVIRVCVTLKRHYI